VILDDDHLESVRQRITLDASLQFRSLCAERERQERYRSDSQRRTQQKKKKKVLR